MDIIKIVFFYDQKNPLCCHLMDIPTTSVLPNSIYCFYLYNFVISVMLYIRYIELCAIVI
jgi:hypothetical protein